MPSQPKGVHLYPVISQEFWVIEQVIEQPQETEVTQSSRSRKGPYLPASSPTVCQRAQWPWCTCHFWVRSQALKSLSIWSDLKLSRDTHFISSPISYHPLGPLRCIWPLWQYLLERLLRRCHNIQETAGFIFLHAYYILPKHSSCITNCAMHYGALQTNKCLCPASQYNAVSAASVMHWKLREIKT